MYHVKMKKKLNNPKKVFSYSKISVKVARIRFNFEIFIIFYCTIRVPNINLIKVPFLPKIIICYLNIIKNHILIIITLFLMKYQQVVFDINLYLESF